MAYIVIDKFKQMEVVRIATMGTFANAVRKSTAKVMGIQERKERQ